MFVDKEDIVAVIDSGLGGISVLNRMIAKFGGGNYIYFADNLCMPYGNKSKKFVEHRIKQIVDLVEKEYKAKYIIIACNTASSSVKFDKNNIFKFDFCKEKTYLMTPLSKKNLKGFNVVSDRGLAKIVEKYYFDKSKLNELVIRHIKRHKLENCSSFVLGCTHYELVGDIFEKFCRFTKIEYNSDSLVESINGCEKNGTTVQVLTSLNDQSYRQKIFDLIRRE